MRAFLEHLLATARAYQATYADKPPSDDPWVQRMRDNNEAEIAALEAQVAGHPQPTEGTTP